MCNDISEEYMEKINVIVDKINNNQKLYSEPNHVYKNFIEKIQKLIKYSEKNIIDECDKHYLSFFDSKKDKELKDLIFKYNLMFD